MSEHLRSGDRFRARALDVPSGNSLLVEATPADGCGRRLLTLSGVSAEPPETPAGRAARQRLQDAVSWRCGWPLHVIVDGDGTSADVLIVGAGIDLRPLSELL